MKRQILRVGLLVAVTLVFLMTQAGTVGQAASGVKRIHFAPGATSAQVGGDLAAGSSIRYVLRALAGQLMELNLSAPQGISFTVTTASGRVLAPVTGGSTAFRGYLPRNGDYIIKITSGQKAGSYSLFISIPQRVVFQPGATSTTIDGVVGAQQSHEFILGAKAGQLMEIDVTPANSLQLIIYGVDGSVLRSGMGEGSSFRGEIPSSQDYIVTVRAGDQAVSFSMNVIIPQRISFKRGAVSATLESRVTTYNSQYYVLRALKGQDMRVNVTSAREVQLVIYGADGSVLMSGMGEAASFSGKLPTTQDYILVVRAGARSAAYSLKVTIQ